MLPLLKDSDGSWCGSTWESNPWSNPCLVISIDFWHPRPLLPASSRPANPTPVSLNNVEICWNLNTMWNFYQFLRGHCTHLYTLYRTCSFLPLTYHFLMCRCLRCPRPICDTSESTQISQSTTAGWAGWAGCLCERMATQADQVEKVPGTGSKRFQKVRDVHSKPKQRCVKHEYFFECPSER